MDGRFSYDLHADGVPELEHVIQQNFFVVTMVGHTGLVLGSGPVQLH
jgi:hypothetical protein